MKRIFLRAGLMASLLLVGWSYQHAYAADMTFPSKCTQYGSAQKGENPTPQQMNCLLTNAALEANIPPEVVKAVAEKESSWKQFDSNGQTYQSSDGGIGIMQITNQVNYDQQRLKDDINYNIQAGVETLLSMYNRTDLPKINGAGQDVIENWYFPVMAYNGTKPVNSPLHQADGSINTAAYQEQVFADIENDSFLGDNPLAQFPFSTSDFSYDLDSSNNIVFNKLEYTLTNKMHATNYLFQAGVKAVTTDSVNLREHPSSSSNSLGVLSVGTTLIINGAFLYDQTNSANQFVWYPVKTEDQKLIGYISSAYISKKLDLPAVNPVDDNDISVSGKAQANVTIQVMNGTHQIGSTTTDGNGNFKAAIPVQKAGSKLTVTYTDVLNEVSPAATITVADKTPPSVPAVNTVTNKASFITGGAEAKATVTAVIAGKTYSVKADSKGYYKIAIPIQNTGTSISVTAKDSSGHVSVARVTTITRVAPNMPAVNTVRYNSRTVTGKTEKYITVSVKIGLKIYSAKSNANGDFKVSIPKQRAGTILYVYATDANKQICATRSVKVSK